MDILEQFDYERNYPKTPKDFTKSSDKKIYFRYPCGHKTPPQRLADKTSKNTGCPACLNRRVIGKSLADEYPETAKMFDEKRNGISAKDISCKNGKDYWWVCLRCGNQFFGKVAYVVAGDQGCRKCGSKRRTIPEYYLGYYLSRLDCTLEFDKKIDGYKFDFYLPKYLLVIEYDGYPWHNTCEARSYDVLKDNICINKGLNLIRLRDSRLNDNPQLKSHVHVFNYDEQFEFFKELPIALKPYTGECDRILDIDVKRDLKCLNRYAMKSENDKNLLQHMPYLSEYIDPYADKNGDPGYVTTATHKIRFWLRHPRYHRLKWSMSAHDLFARKCPETGKIKMCVKVLDMYPELEEQVYEAAENIREETEFNLICSCGATFHKKYSALIARNRKKVTMCKTCLKYSRIKNLTAHRAEMQ